MMMMMMNAGLEADVKDSCGDRNMSQESHGEGNKCDSCRDVKQM